MDPTHISDLFQHTLDRIDELETELDAQQTLAHRLSFYNRFREYPDSYSVTTIDWHDEPNPDGTFDVNVNVVYDEHGDEVRDISGLGAVLPAGRHISSTRYPFTTLLDLWREDPDNPESDIDVAAAHEWFRNLPDPR